MNSSVTQLTCSKSWFHTQRKSTVQIRYNFLIPISTLPTISIFSISPPRPLLASSNVPNCAVKRVVLPITMWPYCFWRPVVRKKPWNTFIRHYNWLKLRGIKRIASWFLKYTRTLHWSIWIWGCHDRWWITSKRRTSSTKELKILPKQKQSWNCLCWSVHRVSRKGHRTSRC